MTPPPHHGTINMQSNDQPPIKGLIIMRTTIIAADGTRYIEEGARRRTAHRLLKVIAAIIATPFLIAALVGIGLAATGNAPSAQAATKVTAPAHTTPKRCEEDQPCWNCRTMGNKICGKVAPPTPTLAQAKKACKIAKGKMLQDCLNLYMRSAWKTPNTYTPAGKVLVPDCISQYRGIELAYCFTQPVN